MQNVDYYNKLKKAKSLILSFFIMYQHFYFTFHTTINVNKMRLQVQFRQRKRLSSSVDFVTKYVKVKGKKY